MHYEAWLVSVRRRRTMKLVALRNLQLVLLLVVAAGLQQVDAGGIVCRARVVTTDGRTLTSAFPCQHVSFGTGAIVDGPLKLASGNTNATACGQEEAVSHDRVVLVTRGECPFTTKADVVATTGAAGMLIMNSDESLPPVGGAAKANISIAITKHSVGVKLQELLAAGFNVTVSWADEAALDIQSGSWIAPAARCQYQRLQLILFGQPNTTVLRGVPTSVGLQYLDPATNDHELAQHLFNHAMPHDLIVLWQHPAAVPRVTQFVGSPLEIIGRMCSENIPLAHADHGMIIGFASQLRDWLQQSLFRQSVAALPKLPHFITVLHPEQVAAPRYFKSDHGAHCSVFTGDCASFVITAPGAPALEDTSSGYLHVEGLQQPHVWNATTLMPYVHSTGPYRSVAAAKSASDKQRHHSWPFLTGDTLRGWASWVIDSLDEVAALRKFMMKNGDVVFVGVDAVPKFCHEFRRHVSAHVALISHNGDTSVPPAECSQILDAPNLIGWWTTNPSIVHPKLHPIPIGIANRMWAHGSVEQVSYAMQHDRSLGSAARQHLLYMSVNVSSNPSQRTAAMQHFANFPGLFTPSVRLPFSDHLETLSHSMFVVSPPGNGEDCHRTWEAIAMGAIPIVTASDPMRPLFEGLPVMVVESWAHVTPESLQAFLPVAKVGASNIGALYARTWFQRILTAVSESLNAVPPAPESPTRVTLVDHISWTQSWAVAAEDAALLAASRHLQNQLARAQAACSLAYRHMINLHTHATLRILQEELMQSTAICAVWGVGDLLASLHEDLAAVQWWQFAAALLPREQDAVWLRSKANRLATLARSDPHPTAATIATIQQTCGELCVVMVHLGARPVPPHVKSALDQLHCTNPNVHVLLVAESMATLPEGLPVSAVRVITLQDLGRTRMHARLDALSIQSSRTDPLWHTATARIFVVEHIHSIAKPQKGIVHIENDVLVYGRLEDLAASHIPVIALTTLNDMWFTGALLWLPPQAKVQTLTGFLTSMLTLPEAVLSPLLQSDIHEMRLLGHFAAMYRSSRTVMPLPSLPDQALTLVNETKWVFDGGSWGQFADGTPTQPGRAFTDPNHRVGAALAAGEVSLSWQNGLPHAVGTSGALVPLFNLHIHSKNLAKFVTCLVQDAAGQ